MKLFKGGNYSVRFFCTQGSVVLLGYKHRWEEKKQLGHEGIQCEIFFCVNWKNYVKYKIGQGEWQFQFLKDVTVITGKI